MPARKDGSSRQQRRSLDRYGRVRHRRALASTRYGLHSRAIQPRHLEIPDKRYRGMPPAREMFLGSQPLVTCSTCTNRLISSSSRPPAFDRVWQCSDQIERLLVILFRLPERAAPERSVARSAPRGDPGSALPAWVQCRAMTSRWISAIAGNSSIIATATLR